MKFALARHTGKNVMTTIIGLAGLRRTGKSVAADHICSEFGFRKIHPFGTGKAMCRDLYRQAGFDEGTQMAMTDGDLKDTPLRGLGVIMGDLNALLAAVPGMVGVYLQAHGLEGRALNDAVTGASLFLPCEVLPEQSSPAAFMSRVDLFMRRIHSEVQSLDESGEPFCNGAIPSRFFMERFGKFMGVEMGPDWTIGKEIDRAIRTDAGDRFLVESVVYEDGVLKDKGATLIKVVRPSIVPVPGLETDAYTHAMSCEYELHNEEASPEAWAAKVAWFCSDVLQLDPVEVHHAAPDLVD